MLGRFIGGSAVEFEERGARGWDLGADIGLFCELCAGLF